MLREAAMSRYTCRKRRVSPSLYPAATHTGSVASDRSSVRMGSTSAAQQQGTARRSTAQPSQAQAPCVLRQSTVNGGGLCAASTRRAPRKQVSGHYTSAREQHMAAHAGCWKGAEGPGKRHTYTGRANQVSAGEACTYTLPKHHERWSGDAPPLRGSSPWMPMTFGLAIHEKRL